MNESMDTSMNESMDISSDSEGTSSDYDDPMMDREASIRLLDLTRNARSKIFNFVEDKYLLQLRKVSKETKATVDSLVATEETVIDEIIGDAYLEEGEEGDKVLITLWFSFIFERSFSLWRVCLIGVLSELIDITSCMKNFGDRSIHVSLHCDVMSKFLSRLRPFMAKTTLHLSLRTDDEIPEFANTLLDFSSWINCPSMSIIQTGPRFAHCLKLIRIIRPKKIRFDFIRHTAESYQCLLRAADTVEEIDVRFNPSDRPTPPSFVIEMLRGKCARLNIARPRHGEHFYSKSEAEQLVELFHYLPKRVTFTSFLHDDELDEIRGEYRIFTFDDVDIDGIAIRPFTITQLEPAADELEEW